MLKKYFLTISFFSCILSGIYAISDINNLEIKKLYINQKALKIQKKLFSIRTNKGSLKTRIVRNDHKGIYVLKKDIIGKASWLFRTHKTTNDTAGECPGCHKWCRNKREMMNHRCYENRRK